ncbi:hypothetical protein R6Z07M_017817 [Ovis aries]
MNRRADYLVTEEEISLTRGPSGLGFNIIGRTDQQYLSNDSSIFISHIKENRAVALDGWLQEGDKICSVNGRDLKNLLHQDAIDLFRNAGYAVSMRVQHRLQLAKQYGPVYTLYLGSQTTVVLHGYEAAKEALIDQGDEFLGRAHIPIIDDTQRGYGLFFSNGDTWKQMRCFSLMTLRDFGMGKRSLEERIQEEAQFLVEELRKSEAQPFNPALTLSCATCNVICSILFNERFHYNDKTLHSLLDLLNKNFNRVSSLWNQIYNLWPKLIKPLPGEHRALSKRLKGVHYFVLEKVKEHQKSLNHNNPRDYIDCFLSRMEQEKQNPESEFHLENLATCGSNLFSAGVEITTATLSYGFLLLMKYPEVQAKVHEEIDRVIGHTRSPCMKDKMKLPYTEAVLHEIQRYITLIPSNLPHTVVRDTKVRQYVIPKGTTVLPLLSSILYNCKEFPNPEKFDPGHFFG